MRIGVTHPVEAFEGPDGKVHAVTAQRGWEFRQTRCGKENPVIGWNDVKDRSALKASRVHDGRCKSAIVKALREEKDHARTQTG